MSCFVAGTWHLRQSFLALEDCNLHSLVAWAGWSAQLRKGGMATGDWDPDGKTPPLKVVSMASIPPKN